MHKQTETENQMPDWLQELRENLADERGPSEPRGNAELGYRDASSSSHELPTESRAKVEPGSDPNCDHCLETKITRASFRRRADAVMPRAENFCDLITADHRVLGDESESRNNHRHAVVVQDLAIQWLQSYPCKTKLLKKPRRAE